MEPSLKTWLKASNIIQGLAQPWLKKHCSLSLLLLKVHLNLLYYLKDQSNYLDPTHPHSLYLIIDHLSLGLD